jgi:hypothetical protein
MTRADLFAVILSLMCALCLFAPDAVANYSRERWEQQDPSSWWWSWHPRNYRTIVAVVSKPWYPVFIRCYGIFGLTFSVVYFVFYRFSK